MPQIFHNNGTVFFNHHGNTLTISNDKEFSEAIKKINAIFQNEELYPFSYKIAIIDLLRCAMNEMNKFKERTCLRNYW